MYTKPILGIKDKLHFEAINTERLPDSLLARLAINFLYLIYLNTKMKQN